jgi:hypothetical protein
VLHIYHPNKSVKGFAASFWYLDKEDSVFATLIKQAGWDNATSTGTFKDSLQDPNKKVNIKLSFTEVAAILDCVERNRPFSNYHDFDEKPKTIKFEPWFTTGENPVQRGYSFSIVVGDKQDSTVKNPFYIGLTFAEAREIREFLIHIFHMHFRKLEKSQSRVQEQLTTSNKTASKPVENVLVDF